MDHHKCFECNKTYSTGSNLAKHTRTRHNVVMKPLSDIICALCFEGNASKKQYETHLVEVHNIVVEKETFKFSTEDEFLTWKKKVETDSVSFFKKGVAKVKKCYYYCHRSGSYKTRGSGRRRLKQMGTNKLNANCPAMIISEKNEDGFLFVTYKKTHVGHLNSVERLKLTDDERKALKLSNKVPVTEKVRNLSPKKVKLSLKISSLKKRHKMSLEMESGSIIKIDENEYHVPLKSNLISVVYVVKKERECSRSCTLLCHECQACLHNYTCTCVDNAVQWNMCKHIHLVCLAKQKKCGETQDTSDYEMVADDMIEIEEQTEENAHCNYLFKSENTLEEVKRKLQGCLQNVSAEVAQCSSVSDGEMLLNFLEHALTSYANYKALRGNESHQSFVPTEIRPHSTNIIEQAFYSAVTKNEKQKSRFKKSTEEETAATFLSLLL